MRGTILKLVTFTIFTIFVTFYLASIIGKIQPFADVYAVQAKFTDATGVLNGDLVKIAGVDVGKVTSFEVDGSEAILTMEIADDVELPSNVIVEIKFRNLLGQRMIMLRAPNEPSSQMLEEGDVIPVENTRPAVDLSVVFNNLRPLIQSTDPQEINTVSRAVLKVFKGKEDDFAQVLGNVDVLAETLTDRDERLARLITDLDQLTEILNGQSQSVKTGIDQFSTFMEELAAQTPRIESVVDRLTEASDDFGGLIKENRAALDQDLDDLNTVLTIVNENLGPLDRIAANLKEVLLATARAGGYGKWLTLYVVNFCPEAVGCVGLGPLGGAE